MLDRIVAQLRKGSIKNVVKFGVKAMPSAPYAVVRPETLPYGRGIRIIAHDLKGTNTNLENYILDEVLDLLDGFTDKDRFGNRFTIKDTGEVAEVAAVSDDSTISMERLFYAPKLA